MAPKKAVKVVKQEKQVCVDAAAQDKKRQNDFACKLTKAPHRIKEFYDKGLKHLEASKSAEKEEFIRQTLATVDFKDAYFEGIEIIRDTEMKKVTESWMPWTAITQKNGPALDRAKISEIKKQHNAYSAVTVDFKMKLAKFSENRHVEQFYAEANASFKAAKKNDSKIIKFLEKVSHGDAIPTEEVENAAALADELKDDVATVRDYLSMMATIATRLTKKRERSAAADTDGEA
ncbi:unnamed protein product [Prorocentrum cordatum]|uniref:BAR domain-containing protein n=1 Tax=Prorocentrum cordatum TaxID=2364126 RepID=A0ABN9WI47_9DINO|nr:unnamed protein product [Polarella glacialis]